MTGEVRRRSIAERLAAKQSAAETAADVEVLSLPEPGSATASFRIAETGELVLDTAASVPTAHVVLDDLDAAVGMGNHLLCVGEDVTGDEIEALAISVWNEAGWTGPAVLHLTEGTTLEGPWPMDDSVRSQLGLNDEDRFAWILRASPLRGARPTPELMAIDEWARAFPEGMPVGSEYKTLLVLRRMARRLAGAVRVAGTGTIIRPEVASAVNLRVYSPTYISQQQMQETLKGTLLPSAGPEREGAPHAQVLGSGAAQVIVGTRVAEKVPRALRWESWITGRVYLYELTWSAAGTQLGPQGRMTRAGMRARETARGVIASAAKALSGQMVQAAIIDEDDFIVAPDELLQPEEPQHP